MKIDRLDRIEITEESFLKIVHWLENNEQLLKENRLPLREGLIVFSYQNGEKGHLYFRNEEETYFLSSHIKDDYWHDFRIGHGSQLSFECIRQSVENAMLRKVEAKNYLHQYFHLLFMGVMIYMNEFEEQTSFLDKKTIRTPITKKGKGGNKKKNKTVMISRAVYGILPPDDLASRKEQNKVKGYWRTNKKTGQRTWVEGYVRGKKKIDL